MLNSIVRFSIRFRWIVVVLACALLGYGIFSLSSAQYDVFPEFAPPQVSIQTEAPGLSPEQVEVLVTQPIENAINGVSGLQSMRSSSIQGLSAIAVVFNDNSDIYRDRQLVAERLSTVASSLPRGVDAPLLAPLTSATSTIVEVGVTSDKLSQMGIRTVIDWTIKPRLLAVPGVAGVEVIGGDVRQIQIQYEPDQLIRYGVSVNQVFAAAGEAIGIRGAGFVDTANQQIVVETEGQSLSPAEIAQTVLVHQDGANVTLGDVAHVVAAPAPPIGAATVDGHLGVVLMIYASYGSNTLEVTSAVDKALKDLGPSLAAQGITLHTSVFRAADFIQTSLGNIRSSLLIGAVLVVIVLFLFLFNLRTAFISCMAIPLSLLAAVVVLEKSGMSLNTMTLGGLSIAIGVVVDDAVIDLENIYRRLREKTGQQPASKVVFDATIEMYGAVVYATFAVLLVFFPILTMTGIAGRLFSPLGIAYIWATLASLLVALTVTPALCFLLLADRQLPPQEPPVVHWLKRGYRGLLLRVERAPRLVIGSIAVLIAAGLLATFFLSTSFLPALREGKVTVHMTAVPGTSLDESVRLGDRVTAALERVPHVVSVAQRAGRAELGTDVVGTNSSEFDVNIQARTGAQVALAQSDIRKTISKFPAAIFSSNTFLTERIDETLSGFRAPVVVNVFGNKLNELDLDGQKVARALSDIPGAGQAQIQAPPGMPQLKVQLRKDALARWGFDPVAVLNAVQTALGGDIAGQIYQGNQVFDVSVIVSPHNRDSVSEIGSLPLKSPSGNYVPLAQLANISMGEGRYVVLHQQAHRVQVITCSLQCQSASSFVAEAQKRIASLSLSPGTFVEFAGTATAEAKSRRDLLLYSVLAGLGIILLLSIVMGNHRNLLLVLTNLFFALVGGVLIAWVTGGKLSLGSLVGFVTLFGITVRNSILLISHFEHLVTVEGMIWNLETALRGAGERLAPILMTALVTGMGLLPLALGSGDPGREIEGPMAIIILGGLLTSTLLNLLVLPTLALRYGKFEEAEG